MYIVPRGGSTRGIHHGGSYGASYCKPKKIHETEILDLKKYLASKYPTPKNTRREYLNTDLFLQQNYLIHD